MTRKSVYANMKAGELARITRERGLKKPNVMTRSEWADFLDADDAKRSKQAPITEEADASEPAAPETDGADNSVLETDDETTDEKTTTRKGRGK